VPPPLSGPPRSNEERGEGAPRFFILTAGELYKVFLRSADEYEATYLAKHGKKFTGKGVPNVALAAVEKYEGAWDSILKLLQE
jgi:hypothetical protein